MDSLLVFLAQAEDQYEEQATPRKQRIDSMKTLIAQAREELSGKNLVKLDSVTAKSDSFLSLGWYIQAEEYAREAAEKIESLKIDEERGNLLRPKIGGTWVCTQVTKHQYDKSVNAVEKKVFQFNSDGSAKFIESKNGKSGKYFKEDWKFVSWGDFGLMGDTIYMAVDRFKAEKQNFTVGKVQEGGKVVWEKQNQPTYDSTITDGSQDRYILYSDLVQDFKKAG